MRRKWHPAGRETLSRPFQADVWSKIAGEGSDSWCLPFLLSMTLYHHSERRGRETKTAWKSVAPVVLHCLPAVWGKADVLESTTGLCYKTCSYEGVNLGDMKLSANTWPCMAKLSLPPETGKSLCSYVTTKIRHFHPAFIYPLLAL